MLIRLDTLTVHRPGDAPRTVELYRGDLTALEPSEAVDVLIVSALRGSYIPTRRSLIGALWRNRGISVAELAEEKAVDLRDYFSCWLSRDLSRRFPDCGFKRVLCFEPVAEAHEVVGHLFQALAPFLGGKQPLATVAAPLVATQALGASVRDVLVPMIDGAVEWMSHGFPLRRLKIVEYPDSSVAGLAAGVFAEVKQKHSRWDVFLSYCRQDWAAADVVTADLRARGLRVFRDAHSLEAGSAWWDEIRNAIKTAGFFLPLYSRGYVKSDACMSELSIALASGKPVLFPVCLCDVGDLPTFMTHHHMELCPDGDSAPLLQACARLAARLAAGGLPVV
ncbi:MAG TPA: toll/interleukin-1 receptor domain-containing protein [Gemmataceae bacterium]|nr:toll/interleukin-1 receptor domain-containing protein [Gemmataceae bacterium]